MLFYLFMTLKRRGKMVDSSTIYIFTELKISLNAVIIVIVI